MTQFRPRVPNVRPAGRIRPARPFDLSLEAVSRFTWSTATKWCKVEVSSFICCGVMLIFVIGYLCEVCLGGLTPNVISRSINEQGHCQDSCGVPIWHNINIVCPDQWLIISVSSYNWSWIILNSVLAICLINYGHKILCWTNGIKCLIDYICETCPNTGLSCSLIFVF